MEEITGNEAAGHQTSDTQLVQHDPLKNENPKIEKPEVIVVKTWNEYLGESLLIIFSVVLALILTEVLTVGLN